MAADSHFPVGPGAGTGPTAGFRLLRYFTLASLAASAAVAVAMGLIEHAERELFRRVQADQAAFFRQTQERFARQQEEASQRDLLLVHEAGHVNLTRVFANVLWEREFAPFVARAQSVDVEKCRRAAEAERAPCLSAAGAAIMGLPGFGAIDARVVETMRRTSVFKIKVFDLRGITVYSSEHAQIGEDKLDNQGWRRAVAGRPASELTHRDRFSAFEGVVENRDLISSYIPVRARDGDRIVGVFEIYSDVTSFLEQIRGASARLRASSEQNQSAIERTAAANQTEMDGFSDRLLAIVAGLLLLLYAALYLVARHAQGIIDRREREREAAILREQSAHQEKMAALGSMAARVAHEIGNPLATIAAYAEQGATEGRREEILSQVSRISAMTRRIADFAAARSERRDVVDVNQMVQAVCDFMEFERRFAATRIEFRGDPALPPCSLVPDQLTEVLMNLLYVCIEGDGARRARSPGRIVLRAEQRDSTTAILIDCDAELSAGDRPPEWAHGPRMEATQRIVRAMGARVEWQGAPLRGVEILLPDGACAPGAAKGTG